MKVNGLMIKQMDKVYILIEMVRNMKDFGKKINKMDMGKKIGQMVRIIKVNIEMGKNLEKEIFIGKMDLDILGIFMRIKLIG